MIENLVQHRVDVLFPLVGVDVEVGVAREHRRQLCLAPVVEDVAWDAVGLGIGQFIAYPQRRAGAFADEYVALAQPCRVLVIDAGITVPTLFHKAQVVLAHMLGQYYICTLDISDDAVVQVSVNAPTADRPRKIYLLRHSQISFIDSQK